MFKIGVASVLLVVVLFGCASNGTRIRNQDTQYVGLNIAKQVVDALCPTPKVPDPRGDFLGGFLDRFNKNRANVELSKQQIEDFNYLKTVCMKPIDTRTDYDYGWLAGGTADQVYQRIQPFFGR